jgi:hypothetical protein
MTATDVRLHRCGCGGEAVMHRYTGGAAIVRCDTCGISTPYLPPEQAAIRWNNAMPKEEEDHG